MAELTGVEDVEVKKKGKGKLFGIIGGVVVLLGAVYFLFIGGGGGEDAAGATATTVPPEGTVIEVDEMTVTLADEPVRYARVQFGVVLPEGGDSAVVGDRIPLLKDAALQVISGYTASDLIGPESLSHLRDDLTGTALEVFADGEVLRVVVTEVLVQ
jgi:flagellar basal body-associated protein FliL